MSASWAWPGSRTCPSAAATRARRWWWTARIYVTTPWSKVYAFDAKTGKQLWKFDPEVPREIAGHQPLLQHLQPRRGVLERQDHLGHARRAPGGGGCEDRQEGLGSADHRSATGTIPSPARRASATASCSSARAAASSTRAASWPRMTPRPARSCGISGPCRAIRPRDPTSGLDSVMPMAAEDLERRVVEDGRRRHAVGRHPLRPADRSRDLRHRQWRALAGEPCARPAAATTCSPPRSLRWMRRPASTSGTTRPCRWTASTYDNTSPLTVADLVVDGQKKHVVMQAPKNGVFYVIEVATGKVLSADPFVPSINWAHRLRQGQQLGAHPQSGCHLRQDRQGLLRGAVADACVASAVVQPEHGSDLLPHALRRRLVRGEKGATILGNQLVDVSIGKQPEGHDAAGAGGHGRVPSGLGSGEAQGGVEAARGQWQRRHADHGRQPGVPGHGRAEVQRRSAPTRAKRSGRCPRRAMSCRARSATPSVACSTSRRSPPPAPALRRPTA